MDKRVFPLAADLLLQAKDFALGRDQRANKADEVCGRPLHPFAVPIFEGALFRNFQVSIEVYFIGESMRRVQGRPQSPWNQEIHSIVP